MAQCDGCTDPLVIPDLVAGVVPAGVSAAQVTEHETNLDLKAPDLGAFVPDTSATQNGAPDTEPVNFS